MELMFINVIPPLITRKPNFKFVQKSNSISGKYTPEQGKNEHVLRAQAEMIKGYNTEANAKKKTIQTEGKYNRRKHKPNAEDKTKE